MNKYQNYICKRLLILLIPLILLFVKSCGPVKEIAPTPVTPYYTPESVMEQIENNQSEFDWFSARFAGTVMWQNQNHNISGTLRIKKDEAIYISLAPVLGIEIARAIITPDSLKFLNRLESSYYIGHIGFLNSMLNTSFDFEILQALLIGNDFEGYNKDSFVIVEDENHIILHDPERYALKNPHESKSMVFNQYLWIDPTNNRIKKNIINELGLQRSISAEYSNFEQIKDEKIPVKLNLLFSDPSSYADLSLQYMRISLNEPQQMNFSVPSRYEPIDFE